MIISFGALGKHGRLGNQLFQLHATLGMAEKAGAKAVFPPWEYGQYFSEYLPTGPAQEHRVHETQFGFYDWSVGRSFDAYGYMQSEKYFGSTLLHFKPGFLDQVKADVPIFDKPTICLHFRRGDYVDNPNYHYLPLNWYIGALFTHFPDWQNCNLLLLSNPEDVGYLHTHFDCLPNAYISEGRSDIEDMALMSLCDNFIISNSSYAWWGARLGEKIGSKIIHSGQLHSGALSHKSTEDYYPERWTHYADENFKIPLQDITFTIPITRDHDDRVANLTMTLWELHNHYDTNIILMEQSGNRFATVGEYANYCKFDGSTFHRTRMLNLMAVKAKTPFVANWDCDVVIPQMQIWQAVQALRQGSDMVFPYDGRFARMTRDPWYKIIVDHRDIGLVHRGNHKGMEPDHNSVGGAVFFNVKSFIEGGMENENFISFSPEDLERDVRFRKLGYKVTRIRGALYHVNHHVGVNSSNKNPFFPVGVAEYRKVEAMTKSGLQEYIATWPWARFTQNSRS